MKLPRFDVNDVGATPGKLVLIGVLAIVFLLVALHTYRSMYPAEDTVAELAQVTKRPQPAITQTASIDRTPTIAIEKKSWPVVSLEEVIKHDPFQIPNSLLTKQPKQAELSEQSAEAKPDPVTVKPQLPQQEVTMVVVGSDRRVAKWGDREIQVGDVVDGFRVLEINPDGIVVAPNSP